MKKYDNYKDSGIEWIGEIPNHWEVKRLKNIGKLYSGLSGKSGSDFEKAPTENYKPFINFTNIANNKYIVNDNFGYVKIDENENQNKVKKNDLFFLMSSENQEDVGKSSLLVDDYEELYLNSFCKGFRLNTNSDARFLNYLLSSSALSQLISLEGRGFTRINLRMEGIENLPILIPKLQEEQTAIANYLDHKTSQIDTLIAKKEQFISLLKEESIAVINQAVTKGLDPNAKMKDSGIEWLGEISEHWEIEKLKFKSKIISKGTTPSTVGCEIIDKGEIRYIKSENIVENCLQNNPEFYIDFETNQIIKRSQLEINDVLIVIAGASIGKVAILTEEFYPSNTNQAVSFIRLNNVNSSIFVWYWLQTSFIKERILFDATQSAQPNLSMESIGNFPIPKLSNNEEMEITTFLHKKTGEIDTIIAKAQQEIELLKEYKTALISEVVTGKVDVRDEVLN